MTETLAQVLQQPAKDELAVGVANGRKAAIQLRLELRQVAVMREYPVLSPQFAHKGMGVLQGYYSLRGFTDMGDDVERADRVVSNQFGDGRLHRGLRVEEQAYPLALKKGDAPAVSVHVGLSTAILETCE